MKVVSEMNEAKSIFFSPEYLHPETFRTYN